MFEVRQATRCAGVFERYPHAMAIIITLYSMYTYPSVLYMYGGVLLSSPTLQKAPHLSLSRAPFDCSKNKNTPYTMLLCTTIR